MAKKNSPCHPATKFAEITIKTQQKVTRNPEIFRQIYQYQYKYQYQYINIMETKQQAAEQTTATNNTTTTATTAFGKYFAAQQ